MPSAFRFLVICQGASQRLDNQAVTLSGVVNQLEVSASEPTELAAMLGIVLRRSMQGKRLDLMAWRLDKTGKRQPISGYVGTPLILPLGLGPSVVPYSIIVPIHQSGIYGFELFDRDGSFASKDSLLATYLYSAIVG